MQVIEYKTLLAEAGQPNLLPGGHFCNGKLANAIAALSRIACKRTKPKIAEIGCAYGDTTKLLAETNPHAEVITFDICKQISPGPYRNPFPHETLDFETIGIHCKECANVEIVVSDVEGIHKAIASNGSYSYIFIDANHGWRGVADDTKLAVEAIQEGGIIAWDDYQRWEGKGPGYYGDVWNFIEVLDHRVEGLTQVHRTRLAYLFVDAERRQQLSEAVADL